MPQTLQLSIQLKVAQPAGKTTAFQHIVHPTLKLVAAVQNTYWPLLCKHTAKVGLACSARQHSLAQPQKERTGRRTAAGVSQARVKAEQDMMRNSSSGCTPLNSGGCDMLHTAPFPGACLSCQSWFIHTVFVPNPAFDS
jgi:hypothetical protein